MFHKAISTRCSTDKASKVFFSEEKKQKTFIPLARGNIPVMPSIVEAAKKQKFFGSFFQKRTFFLP
jgi:hypothetical protein